MEHLVALGHRRIAFIGAQYSHQSNLDLLTGYGQVLEENSISLDDSLVFSGEGTIDGGVRAVQHMLTMPQLPTAFFCFNDLTAMGEIRELRQACAEVPRNCSVVGFDNLEIGWDCCPSLTTVGQTTYRLGQCAINMLFELIQGESNLQPEQFPAKFVVREPVYRRGRRLRRRESGDMRSNQSQEAETLYEYKYRR